MEEISDDYTGYLVEPRIGFTQSGKYTEFIGTYEEETQSVIIPAQCFANTGSVDITVALIDPEDPDHVEVCTPKKFSVTKAPMGTVVLPEEPTWQDYVLNYMKQNLDKLQGPQGDKGEPGDNATINVGSVTTLEPGQEATVTNTGSETNAVLDFGIPKGDKGDKGNPGDNATIEVGTVTTLEPGQNATVQNTGSDTNAVLAFGIPKGEKGDKGDKGDTGLQGIQGDNGDNATIDIGEVTTLEPDQPATVTNTGTETNAVLNFGIPKGEKGDKGDKGDTGDTGPQGDDGNPGQNATITIGTVTTLEPDQEATVQNTGTETNAVLAFGIPKGVQGDIGPQGPQGAPGVNENVLHADISKSENPRVDDAYEAPLQDLKLYGKSTQESTTGKNLWDISKVTTKENQNGTGIVNNGDGSLTVTNSAGNSAVQSDQKLSDICPSLQVGETYVLSGSTSAENADNIYLIGVNIPWTFNTPKAIRQEMLDSYVAFYADSGGNTDTVSNLQMEKGSTATAYEPYTGGAPSPSPDYPQEITCIEEVDCLITGANLFDISTSEDGSIKDGQETAVQGYKRSDYIPVTPGGTISRTPQDITGTSGNFFYDIDKNFLTNISSSSAIDVPENAYYYRFVFKNTLTEVMVNVGETLLPYEPYQSQHVQFTPPAPLYSTLNGSVADYVDVARGKYVYQLKKTLVTSSNIDSLEYYTSTFGGHGFRFRIGDKITDVPNYGICRELKTNAIGDFPSLRCSITTYINALYIFESEKTIDEIKQWLDEISGLNIVYQLATPTEQDIPAETLEALQALKTFNGVTNIFCNAPVSAQYEQSVQIVMNKILEQLNKLQTQTLNLQEEMINNV